MFEENPNVMPYLPEDEKEEHETRLVLPSRQEKLCLKA